MYFLLTAPFLSTSHVWEMKSVKFEKKIQHKS